MASRLNGALSPLNAGTRSGASSPPRQRFPDDQIRPYMRTVLTKTLTGEHLCCPSNALATVDAAGATWDPNDKAKMSSYSKEISDRVKQRMIEIEPRGFKYIVTTSLSENLGQAGRADLSCHWEDTDVAIQEMFSNDSIIFVCLAFAVRVV